MPRPITDEERDQLLAFQARIDEGRQAAEERALYMASLQAAGVTNAAMGEVLGVTSEMIRKSILHRSAEGYYGSGGRDRAASKIT